jgi:Raf kinase inhibitor-like YbhB/YbcL family protein
MKKWILTLAASLFVTTSSYAAINPAVNNAPGTNQVVGQTPSAQAFSLSSPGLANGATAPKVYSCEGNNTSPPLAWKNAPGNTASLALIVYDPDAQGGFYHWVVYNLPKETTGLSANASALPAGAMSGMNTANTVGYHGPCPPPGPAHHYIFTLYALDKMLNLPDHANASAVLQAMGADIIKQTEFTLMYGR